MSNPPPSSTQSRNSNASRLGQPDTRQGHQNMPQGSQPPKPGSTPGSTEGKSGGGDIKRSRQSLRSGNSIVPPESIAGHALSVVIGIMAFLASLTLGAVIMVNQTASDWQTEISREVTIQIKPFDNVETEKAIRDASSIALSIEGISKVTLIDAEATSRLLEPWLGSGLDLGDLPIPRLLTVTMVDDAKPDFALLRQRLQAEVPGASLDDHRAWVGRLTNMAFATVLIGLGVFFLVMAATTLTVVFATRGAMATNRQVVEVLHFVGADNRYIAAQFQWHFLVLGLKGSIAGALLAILLFFALGLWSANSVATPEGDQISALFGTFSIGFSGYFGIALVLLLIAALTALTSRITVHRYVGQLHQMGGTGRK